MRKTGIFGVILIIVSLIMIGLGLYHHGDKSITWENGHFTVVRPVKVSRQNFNNVKNITISANTPVIIKGYSGNKVRVAHLNQSTKLIKNNATKTLNISSKSGPSIGFISNKWNLRPLSIYIPNKLILNQLVVENDETVDLHNLKLTKLNLSSTDDTTITNTTCYQNSNIRITDGDLTLRHIDAHHYLNAETEDGDIDAILAKVKNIKIQTDTNEDDDSTIFGHDRYFYGNVDDKISYHFSTSDGDISIN